MPQPIKRDYMQEEEISQVLRDMEQDPFLKTSPILVKDGVGSVRMISFHEKHSMYLKDHPQTDPQSYLANIKTAIRIRNS